MVVDNADRQYNMVNITANGTVDITVFGNGMAGTETIFRAENRNGWEPEQAVYMDNPLVTNTTAQAVAAWLLETAQLQYGYALEEQGNPFKDVADRETIYDAYQENREAIITKLEYQFDGGLSCSSQATGAAVYSGFISGVKYIIIEK